MLEIGKTALFSDLFLEVLDGAGDVEHLDGTAVTADQVVLMAALAEAVVGSPAVKSDPSDDSSLFKAGDQSVDRGGLSGHSESGIGGDLLQRHGLLRGCENTQAGFERRGSTQTAGRTDCYQLVDGD